MQTMINYIYIFTTALVVFTFVDLLDAHVPNDLWYWIDLYSPF